MGFPPPPTCMTLSCVPQISSFPHGLPPSPSDLFPGIQCSLDYGILGWLVVRKLQLGLPIEIKHSKTAHFRTSVATLAANVGLVLYINKEVGAHSMPLYLWTEELLL